MTKARGKSLRAFQGMLKKTKIQGRVLILSGPGARRAARDDMRSGNAAGDRVTQQPARAGASLLLNAPGEEDRAASRGEPAGKRHLGASDGASVSGRVPPEACSTRKDKTIVWEPLP